MKKDIEAIAELSGVDGKISPVGSKNGTIQSLGLGKLKICNDEGIFSTTDLNGRIFSVRYTITNRPVMGPDPFDDYCKIPYSTYIKWGKPRKLSIKKTTTINPCY